MKNSPFSCQLLMEVAGVEPSDETSEIRFDELVGDGRPMTAFQLDLAEDEAGEIDLWRLLFARDAETLAADWGEKLETPNLEDSRLRKIAMMAVERRHGVFRMLEDVEERQEFEAEVEAEVSRLKAEIARTKQKKAPPADSP